MRRIPLLVAVPLCLTLAVSLSACTPRTAEPTSSTTPSASTPTASAASPATSAAAQDPASTAALTVDLDHATLDDASDALAYARGAKDAWTAVLGSAPTETPREVVGPYDFQQTVFEWPGLQLMVPNDGSPNGASVAITAATVAGHPVRTVQGLSVGSTRADAVAAGAVDGYDAAEMQIGFRDVPGTTSLVRPGEVGREYIMLVLEGDTIVAIRIPGNDFSDL